MKKRALIDVNTNPYLFLTRTGTPLSARGIQLVFRSLKKKELLDFKNLSPHILRHSFALAYIENGGDPFSLRQFDVRAGVKSVERERESERIDGDVYAGGQLQRDGQFYIYGIGWYGDLRNCRGSDRDNCSK